LFAHFLFAFACASTDAAEHVFRGCFQDNFRGLDACMALRMAARSEGLDMLSCEMCATDFCNSLTSH
jgi:hypothetical protein